MKDDQELRENQEPAYETNLEEPNDELSNDLDSLLYVVSSKVWLISIGFSLIVFSFLAWMFFGEIRWTIEGRGIVLDIACEKSVCKQHIVSFFPVENGQGIKKGQMALVEFFIYDPQQYGYLLAKVVEVKPTPLSQIEAAKELHSEGLAEYLVSHEAVNEIILEPIDQQGTYQWTSNEPPKKIENGLVCKVSIILGKIKPIKYIVEK